LSAFRNVHHKGSKNFDLESCVSTSKEKPNTTKATVIVAQSPTSNNSVFKKKCFMIENNGKKLSENNQKQIKGDFHCLEVHIKIMRIKNGSRHSLSQPNKSNLLFFPK